MHKRVIDQQTFMVTALELRFPSRQVGTEACEIITGTHADYGATVLTRSGISYLAHVDEPLSLDRIAGLVIDRDDRPGRSVPAIG